MTIRRTCGGCDHDQLSQILDLGSTPLADRFPASPNVYEERYPLQLLVCRGCALVQLGEVVPDSILWSDYTFYSNTSPGLQKYMEFFAGLMYHRYGSQTTAEIACNDGSLLWRLAGKKVGVDAADGPVKAAQEKGLDVRHGIFGRAMAAQLRDEFGPFGLVVAQNVVAHVADLNDFLTGLADLVSDSGYVVLEVQSLADLLLSNGFDHVYHEHRSFFSAHSLTLALKYGGLIPVFFERTPMQGGSLRVTCRKRQPSEAWNPGRFREYGLTELEALTGLQARAEYLRDRLLEVLDTELQRGVVAGWAASAKSATLLNWCGIGPDRVPYIVDTTPAKIGRYTPGSKIPVVAPGDRPDPSTFLLLAHNYISRIRSDPFRGRWLVPIPVPVVI